MNILAVDTSGNVCSAAVLRDEKVLFEVYADGAKTHSETLAPRVDDCLSGAGLCIGDIDLFCCTVGPGSFTGLRIGAGMIKAFSHASGKPALGVNTLDSLAFNAGETEETVCPLIDARRGEVYTATYGGGRQLTDYRAVPLDTVLEELYGKKTLFLGDGAVGYGDRIKKACDAFRIAHGGMVLQRAGSAGLIAYALYRQGVRQDAYSLAPFYLKETQAERVLAAKTKVE